MTRYEQGFTSEYARTTREQFLRRMIKNAVARRAPPRSSVMRKSAKAGVIRGLGNIFSGLGRAGKGVGQIGSAFNPVPTAAGSRLGRILKVKYPAAREAMLEKYLKSMRRAQLLVAAGVLGPTAVAAANSDWEFD